MHWHEACKFDMIFADPPYFLSNGGISLQRGKVVCVDKGDWDKGKSQEDMMAFNMEWLRLCRDKLKDNGTIWISGTYHNIFSVANCLTELGYKILNVITACQHFMSLFQILDRVCHLGEKRAESST